MDELKKHHRDARTELHVSLDGFEGPLDLLLTMAKSQKVDLKKLQLGILADQFLSYLKDRRYKFKLESAGDYLVMASWLTLLKSQLIIPEDEPNELDTEKINELLALRLQRLSKIREKATWLFDRQLFDKNFFPSGVNRNEKVIKEDVIKVQLGDLLKAYLGIVDKKSYEVGLGSSQQYLLLEKVIGFIEQQVRKSKSLISFPRLVKEIHNVSGISAKSCTASIFCGLLEFAKTGKIEMKQASVFSMLELAKVDNGKKI